MRGLHKVVVGVSAMVLAAGAIVGAQFITVASADRIAVTAPVTSDDTIATAEPTPTTTTLAPTTTTTPFPPTTTPIATTTGTTTATTGTTTGTQPKPKPTTSTPKPRPATGAPCIAAARACIDLSANRSWLLDGAGHVIYGPVRITSGRPGYRTPTGIFHVLYKDIDHRSSLFDDAPMPYSVFFVGGIAFHAGSLSVPSHGCIHLSTAAAQTYFKTLHVGDVVQVVP
ncbi:MAG TPA: L,D-transpeptidase [Pseudonocardiaceae bacterium]